MTNRTRVRRLEGVLPESPVVGAVLLAFAAIVLLGSVVPELERYRVIAIGAVCLIGFALTREYGLAIPAGGVAGGGTGLLFMTGPDPAGAGYFLLAIAAGFAAIWLLGHLAAPPERHPAVIRLALVVRRTGSGRGAGVSDE